MDEPYEQNAKIVYRFLYSICHTKHLAEGLTQETFLEAYKSIERFDGNCKISSWLCQIAKHLLYRHYQKTKHEISSELEETAGLMEAAARYARDHLPAHHRQADIPF